MPAHPKVYSNCSGKVRAAVVALLIGTWSLWPVLTKGQATFVNIGEEKGLSNLQVTDLFQDRYGFIWIGTIHGLNRFDGYGCVQYLHLPNDTAGISSSQISSYAFAEDGAGNLWVATFQGGLNYFVRNTERFRHYRRQKGNPGSLSMDKILAVEADGKGGLWVATAGRGINHFNPEHNRFKAWGADESNPQQLMGSTAATCLEQAANGWLWIGTNAGICRFDPATEHFDYPDCGKSLSNGYVSDILEDSRGTIWVGTAKGLNRWNPAKQVFEPFYFAHEISGNTPDYDYIRRIVEDEDGSLWLGTNGGLLRYNPVDGNFERFLNSTGDPFSIRKGPVNAILKDRDGNIWFGTSNGVSILNKAGQNLQHTRFSPVSEATATITLPEGFNDVIEVDDAIWLATQTGLYRLAETLERVVSGNFTSLYPDKAQMEVYAGTLEQGFYVFDAKTRAGKRHFLKDKVGQKLDPKRVKGTRISSFAIDCQGFVWVAADGGLNRYNPQTGLFRKFFGSQKKLENPSANTHFQLMTDRHGNLWIASMGGLSRLSKTELSKPFESPDLQFEHFLHHTGGNHNAISSDVVFCLLEGVDGRIWAGTDAGLNCFNPETGAWKWFFKEDGLPGNEIVSLVEDHNGNIWVGSAHDGLGKFDTATGRFFRFTPKDGLKASHFRPNAGICTADGFVVMGARDGLAGFQPDRPIHSRSAPPLLYFTDFRVFNRPVAIDPEHGSLRLPVYKTEKIDLRYTQNVISFQFSALNFISPEKQLYRFRLEPFHQGWQYNGNNREVTFTNLDPGTYQLFVETSENGYDWTAKSMRFQVFPPWYRSWWAYLLYIAAFGSLLYGIRRYELNRQSAKAESLRLQALDLAKNRLYTNITHEFRTPLTVILGEAAQLEKSATAKDRSGLSAIRRQGSQLLHLVNQMLDLSKAEAGALPMNLEQGNVIAFLKYLLESFHSLADSRKIALLFEADTDDFMVDFDPDKYQQIVSNLISNALKFTPGGGKITLGVTTGASIVLRVSDTGQGIAPEKLPFIFDRFYQADDAPTRQEEGTGIGLTLTKELVQLFGGQIEVESRPGQGATFQVTLPATRKATRQRQEQTASFFTHRETFPEVASPMSASQFISGIKQDRPRLLLVEDNSDVVRYINSLLTASYHVFNRENGKKGMDAAFRIIPDVIISDVMMPEMDGFELCRILKTDERTSHIPVVLLTAKADQPSKIEGLRFGADVYLSKPFHPEELLVRLEKLIELRRRLQERFKRAGGLMHAATGQAKSADDIFIQKVLRIIGENIADEAFDMQRLSKALNMSRSNLFRKIKALTGQSVANFIRNLRLENARELLLSTDLSVSEVCFRVGFGSPNYFSRAFREAFGVAPSEMQRS